MQMGSIGKACEGDRSHHAEKERYNKTREMVDKAAGRIISLLARGDLAETNWFIRGLTPDELDTVDDLLLRKGWRVNTGVHGLGRYIAPWMRE